MMVERAILLATEKHMGQVDKLGQPYILHPLRVMLAVPPDPVLQAIAVGHDLIEDTDVTAESLYADGWDLEVVDGIVAMTRLPDDDYLNDFIPRCRANPRARVVKPCDILDNLRPERMDQLDQATQERLVPKYLDALQRLR